MVGKINSHRKAIGGISGAFIGLILSMNVHYTLIEIIVSVAGFLPRDFPSSIDAVTLFPIVLNTILSGIVGVLIWRKYGPSLGSGLATGIITGEIVGIIFGITFGVTLAFPFLTHTWQSSTMAEKPSVVFVTIFIFILSSVPTAVTMGIIDATLGGCLGGAVGLISNFLSKKQIDHL